jgi:hypothetical protein
MKTNPLHIFLGVSGVVFVLISTYIVLSVPTKHTEGFAERKERRIPPVVQAPPPPATLPPPPTGPQLAPPPAQPQQTPKITPLSNTDFNAQTSRIENLTAALKAKDDEIQKVKKDKAATDVLVNENLVKIQNLNERLTASEAVKNLSMAEATAVRKLYDTAVAQRNTTEISLRETKLNLQDQVRKNLLLNQDLALTKKDTLKQDNKCTNADNELKNLNITVQRFDIEKKISDDLVSQLKRQVQSATKDPTSQRLQLEFEKATEQNKAIKVQLSDAKTKVAEMERQSVANKAELERLKGQTNLLENEKDILEREMLLAQGRYETVRIANRTASESVKVLEERLAAKEKLTTGIVDQYNSLLKQYKVIEKDNSVSREEKAALQLVTKRQSEEIARLKATPAIKTTIL